MAFASIFSSREENGNKASILKCSEPQYYGTRRLRIFQNAGFASVFARFEVCPIRMFPLCVEQRGEFLSMLKEWMSNLPSPLFVTFPAIDFLEKPTEKIANSDHIIAGHLAASRECKQLADYLKSNCDRKRLVQHFTMPVPWPL